MKQRATRLCAAGTLALALTTATTVLGASAEVRADHGFRKVGYFTQWGIYTRHFVVKNLQDNGSARRLTHINYAFGKVARNAAGDVVCSSGDPWADYQKPFTAREDVNGVGEAWGAPLRGNFNQLKKLKARNPDVKVLISLGGWRWSRYFSDAALTRESRRTFVKSCISLFLKGNLPKLDGGSGGPGTGAGVFDGIDLDWEWPGSPGRAGNIVRRVDGANFTKLVAEFRRQLDRYGGRTGKRYVLTAFLPAAPARIRAGVEVARLFRLLDFATIQGYDFHGTWEHRTNHQAQLFSPPRDPDRARFSLDRAVDIYRARGAPARKLVVGVPYFGRGWTGVPRANDGLYQRSAGAARGTFEAGIEDYRVLNRRRGVHYRDPVHGAHWLYDRTRWWSYDDRIEVARKMRYVIAKRLGGAMMWSLDGDDARGRLTATIDRVLTAG